MTTFESVLLGGIQGITEFLPISSSAHLILVPWFFNINEASVDSLTYDVMLHFGTLLALLVVYWGKVYRVLGEGLRVLKEGNFTQGLLPRIVVGTIPAVIGGLLFKNVIETYLRTPYVVIGTLTAISLVMFTAERIHVQRRDITYTLALIIGIAQAIALVPGISRSGITITVGLLLGLRREEAVDFSFLLSIPIIFGVCLYEARHVSFSGTAAGIYAAGMLSAFVFGIASLGFLISYLRRHSLDVFAYYRIALACLILLFSLK